MKKTYLIGVVSLSFLLQPTIISNSHGQEVSVVANNDANDALPIAQLKNLVKALGVSFQTVQVEFSNVKDELDVVKSELSKSSFCNNNSMVYAPSLAGADANGCNQAAGSPVGTIVLWPSFSIPDGWVEMKGQSVASYPKLKPYFSSTIPNMRGMFVRGADSARPVGSYQADADQRLTASFGRTDRYISASGMAYVSRAGKGGFDGDDGDSKVVHLDSARQVRTANESRPKNVALVYIVKYK